MLVRVAEAFVSYLMFSVIETPVILRMVNDHPYGSRHLLRIEMTSDSTLSGGADTRATPLPYSKRCIILVGVDIYDDPRKGV